ncbi:MAG: glycerate kinase [Actinobacteria bacterium]|nr:glycerate kinase [Actinomycetota bacterium]
MKILVASDKYKGSLTALDVCNTIKRAILYIDPSADVVAVPMADGGEGTVDTLVNSLGGKFVDIKVAGPVGEMVMARFGIVRNDTAVIEMSSASGLVLVPPGKRNPMETTTYGTGQLIAKALDMGCKKIIVGIGGSATNDGGMGMAQALGYRFLGRDGSELGRGGKQLAKLIKINNDSVHPALSSAVFDVACDVENPLTGIQGASYVYALQKGATPGMVRELDRGLANLARVVKKDLGKDIENLKGSGAAGGLGGGLVAFAGAKLRPGAEIVIEAVGLKEKMKGSGLVITGEGAMDIQTFYGKSACAVARLASVYGIPVITINGSVLTGRKETGRSNGELFSGNFSIINKPMNMEEAIRDAGEMLENQVMELMNFYLKIKNKK